MTPPNEDHGFLRDALLRPWLLSGLGVAVLALFTFAWLAKEMLEGDTARFDSGVRTWIHQFASPGVTRAMTAISMMGYGALIVAFVLAIALFLVMKWKRAAAWLALTMAGAVALDIVLKQAFHRIRPEPFFGSAPPSFSFPSGHALASFCFYFVMAGLISTRVQSWMLRVIVWTAAALVVAAIGVSRIYLGVHYPSDVIAGYLAAAMWVGTVIAADRLRQVAKSRAD
ncbi:MAG TPA: phosphatase PAP2 family protein [Alphaproteobacteria bacterium]|nr:phosphatase PAP2 family protein [Alphaproteobacteria bacterium]